MSKEDRFCGVYQATVQPGKLQYYRQEPVRWEFTHHYIDGPHASTVGSVEITMPEDRFHALLDVEERLRRIMDPKGFHEQHPGERLWDEYVRECTIRNECPSVQIAYERYINLLNLVSSNYD